MLERLVKLQNKFVGERVLYLGTGTSVSSLNLNDLNKDVYTFGINRFIPFGLDVWKNLNLDFYLCHDPTVMHTSFYNQMVMRKIEAEEEFDIENNLVKKYKDISTAEYIIKNKIYKKTKVIFPKNLNTSHADRFGLLHNHQWVQKYESEMECSNFMPYKMNGKGFSLAEVKDNAVNLRIWAKNSFVNCAVPILFFLGFSEIYLAGVDYSDKGFFFCKSANHKGFVKKEYDDFNQMMDASENLKHKPKVFTIKHEDTNLIAKNGCVSFDCLI